MIDLLNYALMLALLVSESNEPDWNCADYTYTLVTDLRESGMDAYPMCGFYGSHYYHAWVGVEIDNTIINIEPQTGESVQTYNIDELWPYIENFGKYPDYRFSRRCIVRGLV